jgi:Sec-independent protein translocase protein TatA
LGFGTELVLAVGLGFLVLGPKRMHSLLAQLARAKNEWQKMSAGIRKDLSAGLSSASSNPKNSD